MRCIKFPGLLACVGSEVANQILVNKTQHIVILLAVHRNIVDKIKQIANGLRPRTGRFAKLAQTRLQRRKNIFKTAFMRLAD